MLYDFDHTLNHRLTTSTRWLQPEGRNDVIGMGTADLDYFCPPCLKKALLEVAEENTYNYRYKSDAYYRAVIGFFQRRYGTEIKKEWMNNLPGTNACVRLLLQAFTKPGDYVLMQSPYFSPLVLAIEGAGCQLLTNPLKLTGDRYEIDFQDFEEKVKQYKPSVFLMVNPQNPTGRIFSQSELERMVDICARHHVLILSDEVHFLITYDGKKHIPIINVSEKAREISILLFSMSKGFNIMSIPHAMTVIPNPELQKRWLDFLFSFNYHYATNSFALAAVTAVTGGEADDWLDQCTAYLQHNRDLFLSLIDEEELPITPLKPEASFLFWIDCRRSGLDPERLDAIFLEKAGISLNNGLGHGEDGRGFVRVNFGLTRENLRLAAERMTKVFQ